MHHSVKLVILGENHPQGVELFKYFAKYPEDDYDFLDDGRKIQSVIFYCGQILAKLEVSRVAIVCTITVFRHELTVSVGMDFLLPQPRW